MGAIAQQWRSGGKRGGRKDTPPPMSRRDRQRSFVLFPSQRDLSRAAAKKDNMSQVEARFDDPALVGRAEEAAMALELSPTVAGMVMVDLRPRPETLKLDRNVTNHHGWTMAAMIRGVLGNRCDGLDDLEIARELAKEHLPHIEMDDKSAAYLSKLAELQHKDWQPPKELSLRTLLNEQGRPARFDNAEEN